MVVLKGLKVKLFLIEVVKKYLIKNSLLNSDFLSLKEGDFFYFPLKKELDLDKLKKDLLNVDVVFSSDDLFLVSYDFKEKKKHFSLKDLLKDYFSESELSKLKTAFDVLGSIAIIEVDDEFKSRAKYIGDAILKLNKNIKTVLMKSGIHEGVFRTQKLDFVSGINTKIATYLENNVKINLDVEKIYFSPRLSNERKRISNLISSDGDEVVFEMFSGCAPYSLVIAKNSKPYYVYGVEINPVGHIFGEKSVFLNKLNSKISLIEEDVSKSVEHFYRDIIGLKCSIHDDFNTRLAYSPKLIELYTTENDFFDYYDKLKKTILDLKSKGIRVIVHQPLNKNLSPNMVNDDISNPIYSKMMELSSLDVEFVIHLFSEGKFSVDNVLKNVLSFSKYFSKIYFENGVFNDELSTKEGLLKLVEKTGVNLCIDTCHLLYVYKSSELKDVISELKSKTDLYFHLSDYKDDIHGAKLDENSVINLEEILPLITKGIVEVKPDVISKDDVAIKSWFYLDNFVKKFDRILMPLPKTADDFLDDALKVSKNNTVIHFYDFLNEKKGEIPSKAVEKIDLACKRNNWKYEILDYVKCGDHAPNTYRVCVDFKVYK